MLVNCFCRSKGFLEIENVVLRLLLKMIVLREGELELKEGERSWDCFQEVQGGCAQLCCCVAEYQDEDGKSSVDVRVRPGCGVSLC